jgi:hypothetical protein
MKSKLLVVGASIFFAFCGYIYAQDEVNKFADGYIQYFRNDDFAALYSNMCQTAKVAMSQEGMTGLIKIEKEILGNIIDYINVETLQRTSEGVPETVLNYVADFERGQGVITISIIKENNALKIKVFHIDSPAFLKPKSKELLQNFQLTQK